MTNIDLNTELSSNPSSNLAFKEVKVANDSSSAQFSSAVNGFEVKSQTLTPDTFSNLESSIESLSIVQKLVRNHTIYSDTFEVVRENLLNNPQWGSAPNVNPAERQLIKTNELVVQPKATNKFLQDLGKEADSIMFNQICEAFARAQNKAYLLGDGNDSPRGMLTYSASDVEQITGSSLNAQVIQDLILNLDPVYLEGACFLVNPHVEQMIKSIVDPSGMHIYQASVSGGVATVYGIPLYATNDLPFTGNIKMILSNFKHSYISIQNSNVILTTDSLTEKPFVKYYAIKRVGGDVFNKDAIKLLKIA